MTDERIGMTIGRTRPELEREGSEPTLTPEQKMARKCRLLGEELGAFEERAVAVRWLKRMGYANLAVDLAKGKHWEDPASVTGGPL